MNYPVEPLTRRPEYLETIAFVAAEIWLRSLIENAEKLSKSCGFSVTEKHNL